MKTYRSIIFFGLILLTAVSSSCKKFLEIKPEDQFLDETVYSTPLSIHNVINGVYSNMASKNLYGGHMTMTTIDILAQYYNGDFFAKEKRGNYLLSNYEYQESSVKETFEIIWTSAYQTILNINNFITQLEKASDQVMSAERKSILLGEAYGLRAFLHFDLLRLYGPVYSQGSTTVAIPYITKPSKDIQAILPANKVIEYIVQDLDRAVQLLDKDPVRTNGIERQTGLDPVNDFYKLRNRRMNYFAVKALKARVLLYSGDKIKARENGAALLVECSSIFKWTVGALTLPGIESPDRIFSGEVIFGVENSGLYNMQRDYFSSAIIDANILAPADGRLKEIYPEENDFRYRSSWILDQTQTKAYKTFFKFNAIKDKNSLVNFFQPLIRISELYYILAETEPDPNKALGFLNVVRSNRGLRSIENNSDLKTEIMNEYRREFWGEGQTFFYYKRNARPSIPGGSYVDEVREMSDQTYVIPIPLSETDNR